MRAVGARTLRPKARPGAEGEPPGNVQRAASSGNFRFHGAITRHPCERTAALQSIPPRGGATRALLRVEHEDLDRRSHVLQFGRTDRADSRDKLGTAAQERVDLTRDSNPPDRCLTLQPGNDVDAVTEDIALASLNVSDVQGCARADGFSAGGGIVLTVALLDLDQAAETIEHRGKLEEKGIPDGFDLDTPVGRQSSAHEGTVRVQQRKRLTLVPLRHRGIPHEVRERQDRRRTRACHVMAHGTLPLVWLLLTKPTPFRLAPALRKGNTPPSNLM